MKYNLDEWVFEEISEKLDDIKWCYDDEIKHLEGTSEQYRCEREKEKFIKEFKLFEKFMAILNLSKGFFHHLTIMLEGLLSLVSDDKMIYKEIHKIQKIFNGYRRNYDKALKDQGKSFNKKFNSKNFLYGIKQYPFPYFVSLVSKWKDLKLDYNEAFDIIEKKRSEYEFVSVLYSDYKNENGIYTKSGKNYLRRLENLNNSYGVKYKKINQEIKENIIVYDKLLYVKDYAIDLLEGELKKYLDVLEDQWVLSAQTDMIFKLLNDVKSKISKRIKEYEEKIENAISELEKKDKNTDEEEILNELEEKIHNAKEALENGDNDTAFAIISDVEVSISKINKDLPSDKDAKVKKILAATDRVKKELIASRKNKDKQALQDEDDQNKKDVVTLSDDSNSKKENNEDEKQTDEEPDRVELKDTTSKKIEDGDSINKTFDLETLTYIDADAESEKIKNKLKSSASYVYVDYILERYWYGMTIEDLNLKELRLLVEVCDYYADACDMSDVEKAVYFGTYIEKLFNRDKISTDIRGNVKKFFELSSSEKIVFKSELDYIRLNPEIFDLDEEYKKSISISEKNSIN